MLKMIAQMHGRQEVTTHATIAEARERLVAIAVASGSRISGDDSTGEFILRDRDGNDRVLGWTFGAYLITEVDPEALVYVVEHADGRDEFGSDAEAKHFQTTIAPGSSRYSERAAAPVVEAPAQFIARSGNAGHGRTHLYPIAPRAYKVHGMRYHGTYKALCGSIASSAAVDLGEVATMPEGVHKPCGKCIAAA